jgi:hypothetical protein
VADWHDPKTWKPGDPPTAPILNYEIRDQLLYLYNVVVAPDGETGWIEVDGGIGFDNGWSNLSGSHNPVAAYLKEGNWVSLRGLVTGGTVGASSSTIFTLPSDYRPPKNLFQVVNATNAFGAVNIQDDGDVVARFGTNTFFDLSPIRFRVI